MSSPLPIAKKVGAHNPTKIPNRSALWFIFAFLAVPDRNAYRYGKKAGGIAIPDVRPMARNFEIMLHLLVGW